MKLRLPLLVMMTAAALGLAWASPILWAAHALALAAATAIAAAAQLGPRGSQTPAQTQDKRVSSASSAELNQVIRMVCHDIANPLTVIAGNLEFGLGMIPESEPLLAKAIKKALRATEQQREVLDQVRFYQSLGGRGQPVKSNRVNLGAVIERVTHELSDVIAEREVHINWDREAFGLLEVMADSNVLDRVVVRSLLTLSIKTMETGGTITLASRVLGEQVEFTLSDDGFGLSPEEIEHMFELVSPERPGEARPGVSLGVALSRRFLNFFGAGLEVMPGTRIDGTARGTAFRLTFVKAKAEVIPKKLRLAG